MACSSARDAAGSSAGPSHPAIAYLRTCGGCKRELTIRETDDGGILIAVAEDPRAGEAVFVELEG